MKAKERLTKEASVKWTLDGVNVSSGRFRREFNPIKDRPVQRTGTRLDRSKWAAQLRGFQDKQLELGA
jgi:hypothetical protein